MPVETWALTTLATVKDELGIADDSQDARLTRMIHAATRRFESECSRRFARADYTERIKGQGMNEILLGQWPVVSISSLTLDGVTLVENTDFTALPNDGILPRDYIWRWAAGGHPDLTNDPDPYSARRNIEVSYTAGYVTPEMADQDSSLVRDLPEDLEDACIRYVVFLVMNAPGVKSENTGGGYRKELFTSGLSDEIEQVLCRYRRHDRGDGT